MNRIILTTLILFLTSCASNNYHKSNAFRVETAPFPPVNIVLSNPTTLIADNEIALKKTQEEMLVNSNIFSGITFNDIPDNPYVLYIEYKREQPKDKSNTESAVELTNAMLWAGTLFLVPLKTRENHIYKVEIYKKDNLDLIKSREFN